MATADSLSIRWACSLLASSPVAPLCNLFSQTFISRFSFIINELRTVPDTPLSKTRDLWFSLTRCVTNCRILGASGVFASTALGKYWLGSYCYRIFVPLVPTVLGCASRNEEVGQMEMKRGGQCIEP